MFFPKLKILLLLDSWSSALASGTSSETVSAVDVSNANADSNDLEFICEHSIVSDISATAVAGEEVDLFVSLAHVNLMLFPVIIQNCLLASQLLHLLMRIVNDL